MFNSMCNLSLKFLSKIKQKPELSNSLPSGDSLTYNNSIAECKYDIAILYISFKISIS